MIILFDWNFVNYIVAQKDEQFIKFCCTELNVN